MRIYYDYQILLTQRYGGISRYYYELIRNLDQESGVTAEVKCLFNRNAYFEEYLGKKTRPFYDHIKGKTKANKLYSILQVKNGRFDIIHPTYYDPYILHKCGSKVVLTVHDMIHELFSDSFDLDPKTVDNKRIMIHEADHIIAISESTKKDIIKIYPDIDPDKISVIYHACSFKPSCGSHPDDRFPAKFILFVGNRDGYKNYTGFYHSVKELLDEDPSLYLVCAGGGSFTEEEKVMHGDRASRVVQMSIDDEALSYAYSHAECFVFPSLYEGFGIPTLEAFASGCPVVLSNTSSMPEVGGDAACYIDPYDVDDMKDKIRMVLQSKELRDSLIRKGYERQKEFNWQDTAKKTLDCYKKVMDQG